MEPIRVLIVDDHTLFLDSLCLLLERFQGVEAVAAAGDEREALSLVEEHRPDVLLLEIATQKMNWRELTQKVSRDPAGTRVLILSIHDSEELVTQAIRAGAAGYLLKDSSAQELEIALRRVARGETYVSPAVSPHVVTDSPGLTGGLPTDVDRLTPRQLEVLRLLAAGMTNTAIARQLGVSVKTVQAHRANLMTRLGIHNVAGLVRYAIRIGLIRRDQ